MEQNSKASFFKQYKVFIIIGLIVLGLIVAGLFYLQNNNSTDQLTTENNDQQSTQTSSDSGQSDTKSELSSDEVDNPMDRQNQSSNGSTNQANNTDSSSNDSSQRSHNFYGQEDSEIVVMEAYSFACPSCAEYHKRVLKDLKEEYKDRVKFQVVHFPLEPSFGPDILILHRAAEAAALQGQDKFWAMHDKIFENRNDWVYEDSWYSKMVQYAQEIGLDVAKFEEDYKKDEINNRIKNDIQYLKDIGIAATPTIFINGEKIDNYLIGDLESARTILNKYLDSSN